MVAMKSPTAKSPTAEGEDRSVPESRWDLGCRDPWGRDRALTVLTEADRVLIVSPPGASAVLSAQQTRDLGQALDQAAGSSDHGDDHCVG
jgi:hypothetical protein